MKSRNSDVCLHQPGCAMPSSQVLQNTVTQFPGSITTLSINCLTELATENNRVLVTGGAGFIGSNIANQLAENNDVIAVDDGYLGTPENLTDDVEYVEQSVVDEDLPTDVDVVFHLAALSSYKMHEDNPAKGARVNVEGFVDTIEQARKDGCETIVYATTSSIYGDRTEPSPESMAVEARPERDGGARLRRDERPQQVRGNLSGEQTPARVADQMRQVRGGERAGDPRPLGALPVREHGGGNRERERQRVHEHAAVHSTGSDSCGSTITDWCHHETL